MQSVSLVNGTMFIVHLNIAIIYSILIKLITKKFPCVNKMLIMLGK